MEKKITLIEKVLGSVWTAIWARVGRREAAGGRSEGSLAPFHSSIVRSPCLPCAPRGLRHLILPKSSQPAQLLVYNVTGWKDVYVFQDFFWTRGVQRGRRDGAKGEGVPGRALTVAPASCGSAFWWKKHWLNSSSQSLAGPSGSCYCMWTIFTRAHTSSL